MEGGGSRTEQGELSSHEADLTKSWLTPWGAPEQTLPVKGALHR